MTRKTLETIGGFDPIFFLYGEDDNYLQRMEYHGVKLGLVPKVQIIHDHQENEKNFTSEYRAYRYAQSKLVEYTNILKPISITKQLFYLYRKLCLSIVALNKVKILRLVNEINFFKKYMKKIQKSRNMNIQKQSSWL